MVIKLIDRWLLPFLLLGLLWAILSQGELASWLVGLPCILLAVLAGGRFRHKRKSVVRPWRLPGFAVWFLWNSLRGGVDVAWRALQPQMPLRPGFVHYRLALPPGPSRVLLVNCLSLLPGTLSADIEGDELLLHALVMGDNVVAETREAEWRVAELYGVEVSIHD